MRRKDDASQPPIEESAAADQTALKDVADVHVQRMAEEGRRRSLCVIESAEEAPPILVWGVDMREEDDEDDAVPAASARDRTCSPTSSAAFDHTSADNAPVRGGRTSNRVVFSPEPAGYASSDDEAGSISFCLGFDFTTCCSSSAQYPN